MNQSKQMKLKIVGILTIAILAAFSANHSVAETVDLSKSVCGSSAAKAALKSLVNLVKPDQLPLVQLSLTNIEETGRFETFPVQIEYSVVVESGLGSVQYKVTALENEIEKKCKIKSVKKVYEE